ncbi:hypothetical protein [Streptomyces katsurahamanus]|uniref:PD-(D/E)XK nuclease family protein n=1 Tax=Streptomyces katsurahamanus TaxID=2577098 RepID=A0ABW9P250_9ACTN|nr:hypothetical protein [Streptomyces katsurahamanus]MQS39592.1 PD-(D/E)XK nuclease family protein [Streptomyces katsurahamanus]
MAGKVSTIQRGNSRFYVDAETHEKVPGVTSVIGMLPKPFLTYWAAKMTAEAAVDNLPAVTSIAERDRDGAVDYLKGAHRRYTKLRAEIGSDAHDLFERMIRGEYVPRRVHPDLQPYREGFAEFLDVVQPELIRAEDVAWSDQHKYAGSFDALLRVKDDDGTPTTVIVDWKTSKATYPDVALQMSAYGFADRLIDPEGNSEPMPHIDAAAVLHITADQWSFKPVRFDAEVFGHFLTLRRTFDWDREVSKTVIGKPFASGGQRIVTGTQRRAR